MNTVQIAILVGAVIAAVVIRALPDLNHWALAESALAAEARQ